MQAVAHKSVSSGRRVRYGLLNCTEQVEDACRDPRKLGPGETGLERLSVAQGSEEGARMHMANLSIRVKISTAFLAAVVFLPVICPGQVTNKATPTPSTESAKTTQPGDKQLCSGASSGAIAGHAPSQGKLHPHFVTLSWNAALPVSNSPQDAIKGYYVYRSRTSHTYAEVNRISKSLVQGTQCVDTTVEPQKTYFYVVKAVTEGGEQSGSSIEIKAIVPSP